jgi:CarboxypepD_reg-like domain/Leucine rich repeat/Gram-negative bacterial TonB protein C-terminal
MKYLLFACFWFVSLDVAAQTRLITGRILDKETKEPIENVNIVVRGTTSGSVSNYRGYFEITLASGTESLVLSHVSYQTVALRVPAADKFLVELEKAYIVLPKAVLSVKPPELSAFSQPTEQIKPTTEFRVVEENADFTGGTDYLLNYLAHNFNYPAELTTAMSGETYVSFEIGETGAISNIKVHDDSLALPMKNEIIRLFSAMPAWQPARQRGHPVSQKQIIPVVYGPVYKIDETTTYLNYFLHKTITYPPEARRLAVEGTVFVYFALNNQQNFTKLKILQGVGHGCDSTVYHSIRAIPKAELRNLMENIGDSVFVLPVNFRLDPRPSEEDPLRVLTDAVFLIPITVYASDIGHELGQSGNPFAYPTHEFYSVEGAAKHIENANRLVIVNQHLKSLSPDVGRLKNLVYINLASNKLQSLPNEIGYLYYLKELYAPQNNLSTLPKTLGNLKYLRVVALGDNNFTDFPSVLLSLKRMQALDLSNNKIASLPTEIGGLKKLRILIMHNNQLESLPESFFNLKLTELNLAGNNFSEVLKSRINDTFKDAKITL